ncbi:MAG: hypothetical protein SW019_24665 [Actinomycetota bacterium]|nr:hypothetical protein [Actinomycetota bacterium]
MSDKPGDGEHSRGLDAYQGDLDAVEQRIAREINPGSRALVLAILVFALLVTFVLPHTGAARGFDVLVGSDVATDSGIALPSRVFTWIVLVFGVGFSILALVTRRWALAWIALAGSTVASFLGLLAVWSRQTAVGSYPGPGFGLIIAWIAVILLTYHWARVVAERTALQLASEEHRRRAASEQQRKGLLDGLGDQQEPPRDSAG